MTEQDEQDGPQHVVAQAGLASAHAATGPEQQQDEQDEQDEPETAGTEGEG